MLTGTDVTDDSALFPVLMENHRTSVNWVGLLPLLQLIDSAFPTGAFAHSFGLETAVQEGRVQEAGDLYKWLKSYILGSLATFDAIGVYWSHAYVMKLKNAADLCGCLIDLDRRLTVARLARESRVGSSKIAKRYLHTVQELYPQSGLEEYTKWIREELCFGSGCIVHGWISAYLQQSAETAVLTHMYATINSLLQVALRAMALGQTDAQKVMQAILPLLVAETTRLIANPPAQQDMYTDVFYHEIAAMRHETLYSRLFMS